ncbi:hypothetical protein ACVBEJ_14245 [Porticoccus sp. GXU_MW_L64]
MHYCSMPGVKQDNGENEPADPLFDPDYEVFDGDYDNEENINMDVLTDGEYINLIHGEFLTYRAVSNPKSPGSSIGVIVTRVVYSDWELVENESLQSDAGAAAQTLGAALELAKKTGPGRIADITGQVMESTATNVWRRTVQYETLYAEYSTTGFTRYQGDWRKPGIPRAIEKVRNYDTRRTGRVKWAINRRKLQIISSPAKYGSPPKGDLGAFGRTLGKDLREYDLN